MDGSIQFRRNYMGEDVPMVIRTGGITGTLPPMSRNSPATTTTATPTPVLSTASVSQSSPTSTVTTSATTDTAVVTSATATEDSTDTSQSVPNSKEAPPSLDSRKMNEENLKPFRPIGKPKGSVTTKPLPSEDVLLALFDRLMTRMKLPPERVAELNTRTPQQKWSMILSQSEIESSIACVFYIEQLVRHTQPELKEKRPKKRLLLNLQPLSKVLKDLEEDIRTNPNDSWVKDFVNSPNHGHVALVDLIKDIADNNTAVTRKNPKKYPMLDREPDCLYTALLCLKALMGHRKALGAILKYDPSLSVLAYCLDSSEVKVKILILKIFVTVLLVPGGHRKVMQAFDYFRAVMKEKMRFQILMSSLTRGPVDTDYQAGLLCFINTVVQTSPNPNSKTFHQTEFLEAGFNPDELEKALRGRQDERILHEIKEWRKNFIDVQSIMDDLVISKGKIRSAENELKSAHKHLKEANADRESLYEQMKAWIDKYDRQKQKMAEMTKAISEVQALKKERDSLLEEKKELLEDKTNYSTHISELKKKLQQIQDENKALLNREVLVQEQVDSINKHQTPLAIDTNAGHESPPIPSPTSPVEQGSLTFQSESIESPENPAPGPSPPPPPPPPPPPFHLGMDDPSIPPPPPIPFGVPPPPPPIGSFDKPKRAVVPHVSLPMLNWLPIEDPEHTIFKDMDDEGIIETVDFSEFETLFQMKTPQKKKKKETQTKKKPKAAEEFRIIENNRSRNLNIAQRRIGLLPAVVAKAVETSDLDTLSSEHCELLLKFIPAEKEIKDLERNKDKLDRFGEAELFLYEVSKVDRYEARLQCMTYMGTFDELVRTVQPQINAVSAAALSILRSTRLKKVFEIILAFGNYMNSSRKGAAHGFRLESLTKISDTKSQDKKQTLLSYIAHVVEKVFPNVLTFHEDLDVQNACSVSRALLSEEVSNLRKGRKIIEAEMEKDPQNFVIFSFHMQTSKKMEHLEDSYSKMEHSYREVLLMFSENADTTEPSDFFKIFSNFISNWKDAVKKNRKQKKVQMGSTMDLLRKQEEEESHVVTDMRSLAAEAAAIAAARSEKIRRKILQKRGDREVKSDGEDEEDEGEVEKNGWLKKYTTAGQRTDRSGLSSSRSYTHELDMEQFQSGFDSSHKDAQDSDYYDHIHDSGTDSD